jgi:CRISPR-associated protein Cmr3
MKTWLIEPRDPLVFRDGKPFTAIPGARAVSIPFPLPSTLAGAVRTRSGKIQHNWHFPAGDEQAIADLLNKQVIGPLLCAVGPDEVVQDLFLPAPQDALVLQRDPSDTVHGDLVPLVPRESDAVQTNLPDGLRLLYPTQPAKAKPHKNAPDFWSWAQLLDWLQTPREAEKVELASLGLRGLEYAYRTHVSINPRTSTAQEGALFQTGGLEFVMAKRDDGYRHVCLSQTRQFGLLLTTDAELKSGPDFLGGERRVVQWREAQFDLPGCPDAVRSVINQTKRGRLILATPGIFEKGYLPTWVCQAVPGVKVRIVAAAVSRYQSISGWDYKKGEPKPSRRLAPAGSVYFFEIEGDEKGIDDFIEGAWWKPISDAEQDRRDGFGVALVGVWPEVGEEVQ